MNLSFLHLRRRATEFLWFGIKQAYACLFAGTLLAIILVTKMWWPQGAVLARYDFLFLAALAIQAALILFRLETPEEVKVIFIFHLVGTAMEIFKTAMGSWAYPEENLIRIAGVPLFSGFMYAAVGSYLARAWRIFRFRFTHFPNTAPMAVLCLLIYVNFFTHHFVWDARWALFAGVAVLFFRTRIYFTPRRSTYWMPLLLGFVLVALFLWIAENLGTFGAVWVYPQQRAGWTLVPLTKMGSWFLLMFISFVLVSLIHRRQNETGREEGALVHAALLDNVEKGEHQNESADCEQRNHDHAP